MDQKADYARIFDQVKDARVLKLEQALLRIPSSSFQEGKIADFLAEWLAKMGCEV